MPTTPKLRLKGRGLAAVIAAHRAPEPFLVDATPPVDRFQIEKPASEEQLKRSLVKLNPHHPHHLYTATVDKHMKELRQLSNEKLEATCNQHFAVLQHNEPELYAATPWPETRADKMGFMREHLKRHFKQAWKRNYGWEFEDCYEPQLFFAHLKRMKETGFKPGLADEERFTPKPEAHQVIEPAVSAMVSEEEFQAALDRLPDDGR